MDYCARKEKLRRFRAMQTFINIISFAIFKEAAWYSRKNIAQGIRGLVLVLASSLITCATLGKSL